MAAFLDRAPFVPISLCGAAGPLFAVHYPSARADAGHAVLYLPPFAEEANRSRRMAALLARKLAETGIGTMLLDPYGCGDSGGEFSEARWPVWREDGTRAVRWLRERGYQRITLLGLRLGALLALDTVANADLPIDRVLLWQPVLRGDQMVTQFLRLRLAAELAGGGRGDGTAELRRQLAAEQMVEIAGYELHHELASAIDALRLGELGLRCRAPIDWIDVMADPAQASSPANEQVVQRWHQANVDFRHHKVAGEPFWALQETTIAPGLLALTRDLLEAGA
ncbi:MAG TPA: hydrolase 2, exosortase A system-associated [Alphaproteobacteria bacterium]|nr:hydrolase 2, exosortase A system-associated [Alphaproteobacteria bacterium]